MLFQFEVHLRIRFDVKIIPLVHLVYTIVKLALLFL